MRQQGSHAITHYLTCSKIIIIPTIYKIISENINDKETLEQQCLPFLHGSFSPLDGITRKSVDSDLIMPHSSSLSCISEVLYILLYKFLVTS